MNTESGYYALSAKIKQELECVRTQNLKTFLCSVLSASKKQLSMWNK